MKKVKVKVTELNNAALAYTVAKLEGYKHVSFQQLDSMQVFVSNKKDESFAYDPVGYIFNGWNDAGPIIEREAITLRVNACNPGHWAAFIDFGSSNTNVKARKSGPTPLIAAMRCYVASKLGNEVDVPDELLGD